jgi:hypothetical protein
MRERFPGYLAAGLLLAVGVAAALSLDVVQAGYGLKSDEATYVSMALSLAHDGDLAFDRRDLERFWTIYQSGPEGVFLKRGEQVYWSLTSRWPLVKVTRQPDPGRRLYYGKAFLYPAVAAPFVWLAGLNGFFVLHAVLIAGMFLAGYLFLAPSTRTASAMVFTGAFLGVSILPIHAVYLMPEIFNAAVVFFAYFLWLYKEVAPPATSALGRWLRSRQSDLAAAMLLGLATYSKLIPLPLVGPLLAWALWRRRFRNAMLTGLVFALTVVATFGLNVAITGEISYQGGDRKSFYGHFPFDNDGSTFETSGVGMTTEGVDVGDVLGPNPWSRFAVNLEYFLIGRHFGFVPYFFPGVVVAVLALRRWRAPDVPRLLILATVGAIAIGVLVLVPTSWSGGGGPPGNRYFVSVYPALFFLTPPLRSIVPAVIAWVGGAAFLAHMLVNPFVAAKTTWVNVERGLVRLLPVELTCVNDLPVRLNAARSRRPYGENPELLLYFLDGNAYPPEGGNMWVAGRARADIIVRADRPFTHLTLTLESPMVNTVEVSAGSGTSTQTLAPNQPVTVTIRATGVQTIGFASLLSIRTSDGFVPRLVEAGSRDSRYLGVHVSLRAGG